MPAERPSQSRQHPLGGIRFFIGLCASLLGWTIATPAQSTDRSTLKGKVMCGYQGWFSCGGDQAGVGWTHWSKQRWKGVRPGLAKFELWPDITEHPAAERFRTGFKHADGRPAELFSSHQEATVLRHFKWMRDYGIDGAFVQRFPVDFPDTVWSKRVDHVLAHCRKGAEQHGLAYAVMYDLSRMKGAGFKTISDDWRKLRGSQRITSGHAYLQHNGKPLVGIWGVGFDDKRDYSLKDCRRLIESLRAQGCSVLLGTPTGWREQKYDSDQDPDLHAVLKLADVISPWTIGRYRTPAEATRHGESMWQPDIAWCAQERIDYLPVVFPGFSWHNQQGDAFDDIPRLKGGFLWSQFTAAKRSGAEMIYVAMFDEVDEGTAIFKCTNDPPVGDGARFLTYEGLPSDFYLRLTGRGGRLLRGEIPISDQIPVFSPPSSR